MCEASSVVRALLSEEADALLAEELPACTLGLPGRTYTGNKSKRLQEKSGSVADGEEGSDG